MSDRLFFYDRDGEELIVGVGDVVVVDNQRNTVALKNIKVLYPRGSTMPGTLGVDVDRTARTPERLLRWAIKLEMGALTTMVQERIRQLDDLLSVWEHEMIGVLNEAHRSAETPVVTDQQTETTNA